MTTFSVIIHSHSMFGFILLEWQTTHNSGNDGEKLAEICWESQGESGEASWDGGIDGGNAAWTISGEGNAGYGRAAFLSSIGECGVCCYGVKLGEGARRDSYLFLRIPKIWLRRYEDMQKTETKSSTSIFVPGVIGIHVKSTNLKFVDQSNF